MPSEEPWSVSRSFNHQSRLPRDTQLTLWSLNQFRLLPWSAGSDHTHKMFMTSREAFHFIHRFVFIVHSKPGGEKRRLLNLIGWKIWSFCFWRHGGPGRCWTQSWEFPIVLQVSGLEIVKEIGSSLSRPVRFLLMTFPLTTGYNMFIDPCVLNPLISLCNTVSNICTRGWGLYGLAIQRDL